MKILVEYEYELHKCLPKSGSTRKYFWIEWYKIVTIMKHFTPRNFIIHPKPINQPATAYIQWKTDLVQLAQDLQTATFDFYSTKLSPKTEPTMRRATKPSASSVSKVLRGLDFQTYPTIEFKVVDHCIPASDPTYSELQRCLAAFVLGKEKEEKLDTTNVE